MKKLIAAKKILAEQGTHPEHLADEQAEADDDKRDGEGGDDFHHEVGSVGVEPNTHLRQLGQKYVVEEVNVECAHSDVLQRAPDGLVPCEPLLIVTEEHNGEGEQREHRDCARQICPLEAQRVPTEEFGARGECHNHEQGEEPTAVEDLLHALPIAMDKVAKEEERQEVDGLDEARVAEECGLVVGEIVGHVECLIGKETQEE